MRTYSFLGCECFATKKASVRPAVFLKLLLCVFIHAHLFNPRLWMFCHKRGIHKACCLFEIALVCIYTCTLVQSLTVNVFHKRCINKACCLFEIALVCIYTFNPLLWKLCHKKGINKVCCLLDQKSHPVCSNIAHEFGFRFLKSFSNFCFLHSA